jgi:hypothetical protein
MLYMTVYAVRQGSCVNNFAIETAEINIEVKHHLFKLKMFSVRMSYFFMVDHG